MKIDADMMPPELGKPADLSAMKAAINSKLIDSAKQANAVLDVSTSNDSSDDQVRSENE